jgi:hypothetical protein
MLISRVLAVSISLGLFPSIVAADCSVRDFMTVPLPPISDRPAFADALEIAFPGVVVDLDADHMTIDEAILPLGAVQKRTMAAQIADGTIRDQFSIAYPLDFDLSKREEPWFDPGRVRNDPMFRALYGSTESQVASGLARADYNGANTTARFAASDRHCVAHQLQAALDAIAAEGPSMDKYFQSVGGSFNWRTIAGTNRLSAHSFGTAVDFNTKLGGYWRWAGASEGRVGPYENQYPRVLVEHMERFGFIWGGKWHHFDGMHFEYRPELILHSRMLAEGRS